MSEFPAKVSTETSSHPSQGVSSYQTFTSRYVTVDLSFIRTITAILMLVEIVLGLLVWALIAGSHVSAIPAYGWVMFVSVTLWLLTIFLFFIFFLGLYKKFHFFPWPMLVLVYNAVATALYLTAFLTNSASVTPYKGMAFHNNLAAAAFFGIVVTLTYGASTFFAFMDWKGDGGNAAANTVPV